MPLLCRIMTVQYPVESLNEPLIIVAPEHGDAEVSLVEGVERGTVPYYDSMVEN